jgi:N-acetylmuramoyl-L-alanine amidase
MQSGAEAIARLCDPQAEVSAHYVVDEDGRILQLVDERLRAWHAGIAYWRGIRDINSVSIGIELVNPGHAYGYRPFPDMQIAAVIALTGDIMQRHALRPEDVIGHADVAPGRKQDPGELFPWQRLGEAGIGLWPNGSKNAGDIGLWDGLSAIGYAVPNGDGADILAPETAAHDVIHAFQQRFRPHKLDGVADAETRGLIAAVADLAQAGRCPTT